MIISIVLLGVMLTMIISIMLLRVKLLITTIRAFLVLLVLLPPAAVVVIMTEAPDITVRTPTNLSTISFAPLRSALQ